MWEGENGPQMSLLRGPREVFVFGCPCGFWADNFVAMHILLIRTLDNPIPLQIRMSQQARL
jgi:hypothetical protein